MWKGETDVLSAKNADEITSIREPCEAISRMSVESHHSFIARCALIPSTYVAISKRM